MKNIAIMGIFMLLSLSTFAQKKVLIFSETAGYHHNSIPTGVAAISEIAREHDFQVDTTSVSDVFQNTLDYDLIIFLNTTGDVLNDLEQGNFQQYIENGGNYFGIHAAADTEYDWPFYGKLVGAYFESHPHIQEAEVDVVSDSPLVSFLPKKWKRTDEWYNYKDIQDNLTVLLQLNESSYEGGKNGKFHPTAWYQKTGFGGIAFYTGGGHTDEAYSEPLFRKHLENAMLFAMGEKPTIKQ
ncbi:MAG: ThuA domain-containing protein [Christiangramia sp.]|uniref:ThuA domain-containing protein n=1 Tax=Christiangramia sp. TaxID=1931228 RepID=UPI003241C6AC